MGCPLTLVVQYNSLDGIFLLSQVLPSLLAYPLPVNLESPRSCLMASGLKEKLAVKVYCQL
ncbi:MAG: hypothetical protein ACK2UM_01210 [Anaerolineales bacterium]